MKVILLSVGEWTKLRASSLSQISACGEMEAPEVQGAPFYSGCYCFAHVFASDAAPCPRSHPVRVLLHSCIQVSISVSVLSILSPAFFLNLLLQRCPLPSSNGPNPLLSSKRVSPYSCSSLLTPYLPSSLLASLRSKFRPEFIPHLHQERDNLKQWVSPLQKAVWQ